MKLKSSSGLTNFCTEVRSCAVENYLNRRHILVLKKPVDQGQKGIIRGFLKHHQIGLRGSGCLDVRLVPYPLLQSRLGEAHLINQNKLRSSRKEKAPRLFVLQFLQLSC